LSNTKAETGEWEGLISSGCRHLQGLTLMDLYPGLRSRRSLRPGL